MLKLLMRMRLPALCAATVLSARTICSLGSMNQYEKIDISTQAQESVVSSIRLEMEEPETEAVFVETVEETAPDMSLPLTNEEIELIAIITMAEAEGESEKGKRLVIDTILNRMDSEYFPDTVHGVVYQKSQFSSVWNGRTKRCYPQDDICQLVREELVNRSNDEVMFFTAGGYSNYGKPMFRVENHYFSSYE